MPESKENFLINSVFLAVELVYLFVFWAVFGSLTSVQFQISAIMAKQPKKGRNVVYKTTIPFKILMAQDLLNF